MRPLWVNAPAPNTSMTQRFNEALSLAKNGNDEDAAPLCKTSLTQ